MLNFKSRPYIITFVALREFRDRNKLYAHLKICNIIEECRVFNVIILKIT